MPILGTSVDAIDLAEDRGRFGELLERLGYKAPPYATARLDRGGAGRAARASATRCSCARPTCSAAARWRSSTRATASRDYLDAPRAATAATIFLDRFLENAIEVDVDALCDGEDVWIGGIMQHVEEAGIHSGDSACVLPPHSLGPEMLEQIRAATRGHRARRSASSGCCNVQYAVHGGRAVRDRGQPARLADGAVRLQGDRRAAGQDGLPADARREARRPRRCRAERRAAGPRLRQGGGAAVRPLRGLRRGARPGDALDRRGDGRRARLPDARSPRRRRRRARRCRARARSSSRSPTPTRPAPVAVAQLLHDLGFRIVATRGTAEAIQRWGVPGRRRSTRSPRARRHVVDWIERGEVDLVVNTPTGSGARTDGWEIRRAAVAARHPVPDDAERRPQRRARDRRRRARATPR